MKTVRWNIAVSSEVDQSVRMFLAARGGGRKGDLSRFIDEAVHAYLAQLAADQVEPTATDKREIETTDPNDYAKQWQRRNENTKVVREMQEGKTYAIPRRDAPIARLGSIKQDYELRCIKPARQRLDPTALRRVTSKVPTASVLDDLRGER